MWCDVDVPGPVMLCARAVKVAAGGDLSRRVAIRHVGDGLTGTLETMDTRQYWNLVTGQSTDSLASMVCGSKTAS
jgi:hypothetical protein